MAETRPSGLPVIPDHSAVVVQEVTEIDERGRLHLLPRWTRRVSWLPLPAKENVDALMVLVKPGYISLRQWKGNGPRIEKRYKEIAKESDVDALEALRLIQDRYKRLTINKERRPHIGDAALAHLGLPITRGMKSTVYVAIFPSQIDILSPAYRNAKLEAGHARIDDLP